jgi:uncharacterized protein
VTNASIQQLTVMGREIMFDPAPVRPSPPEEERFPEITSLAIDVSGGCNLKCGYCAESMTLPQRAPMDRELLALSVERLFEWSDPGARLSIFFGSGEPLLQPESVKAAGKLARRMARKNNRDLSLFLTTNGTLLDARTLRWLAADGWEVKVSLDGPREVHDRFRMDGLGSGTYDRIERHVRTLSRKIPERFSTTSVLCKGSDPAHIFHAIAGLGVRTMEIVPAAAPPGAAFLPGETEMEGYRAFILAYAKKAAKYRQIPVLTRFQTRLRRVLGIGNQQIACGAGRTLFAVGPRGGLYPCYRFVGLDEFKLGELQAGLSNEAVQRFTTRCARPSSEREQCRRCWASPLCDGPCFAGAALIGKGSPPPGFCEMIRADCEAALWLADTLRVKKPKKLCHLAGIHLAS